MSEWPGGTVMIGLIQKVLVEVLDNLGGDDLRKAVFVRAGVAPSATFRTATTPTKSAGG